MGKKYVVQIDGDISALQKKVSQANSTMQDLGKNKVAIDIDYDHGKIEDIRNLVQSISEYSPEIKVQLNYDLFEATYKQKTKELAERQNLLSLFNSEKSGNGGLSQYIDDLMAEIDDGLDSGISKIDLQSKLEHALDLSGSYTKITGKYLDDLSLNSLFDMQNRFPKLEDYAPKENLFDGLEDQLKKDQAIIEGITLQMGDLKAKGAVSGEDIIDATKTQEAADQIDNIQGKLEKISEAKTVTIFDGVSEQVYDVEKDIDSLMAKLEEMAKKMKSPVFQAGDLRKEVVNSDEFLPGDSLGTMLRRGTGATAGTGQYSASQLVDVLEWLHAHEEDGFDRGIFAFDLEKYDSLLKVPSAEYYDGLVELFGNIHNLIASDIIETPEGVKSYAEKLKGKTAADIFGDYKTYFNDLGVSMSDFETFIQSQRAELQELVDTSDGMNDVIQKTKRSDAFGTRFLKQFTKYKGIDATGIDMDDSVALGNLVYSINKDNPFDINFNGNEDIARQFYSMVLNNILSKKAKNASVDASTLVDSFVDDKQADMMGEKLVASLRSSVEAAASSAKEFSFNDFNTSVDELIARLQRLYQLQNTISNMDVEAFHGASYEEAGKHIEKLNAEYEQTIAEIDKLRAADDGSPAIKEQIGLLENLAVAYEKAIDSSIPNDVRPSDFISKYTNLSFDTLYGDERSYRLKSMRDSVAEFNGSIQDEILNIYRTGGLSDIEMPDMTPKTSALEEIPEILGRIKSAYKETEQAAESFADSASGEDLDNRPEFADGSEQSAESAEAAAQAHEHATKAAQEQAAAESALGDTPEFEGDTSEISQKNADGIREETQANKELTDSYRERSNAQDDAETQSSESTGATQAIQEETEANNEAAESYRDKAKAQEEVNTATSQSDTHTQDIREETEANEAAAKSARELADAEQEAAKAQQNKSLADQQTTASDTAESTGFDNVAQSATAAAQAKERFASANEKAKSAAEATTSSLMEEARAFKEIAEMGKQATSAKNGFVKEPKSERKSSVTQKQKDNEGISWRATSIKREFAGLTKAVGSNESLSELYGEQIDDFQKRVAKISSKTTTSEFEDLAADIRKVAEEIKNVDVDDIVSGFDKLKSGKNVIKNLFDVDDSKDAINSAALDEFIGKLDNLKSRVESVKDVFGEDSDQYITASEALDKYSESLEQYYKLYMDRSIDSMRNKLDISDVAEGQQEKFDEARSAFKEMTQIAEGFSIDEIFDSEKISSFVANLKIATDSTKDLKSKFDGLASTAQVDKLFSKVSADIKSNNLSGDLLGDFTKLREELAGATEDSEAVRRGFANISKEDFSKLVGQWQALRKEMYQTGQDGKSFFTRIGEAMTTQSAAFIARYFSFQDYIRYARELISTVTTLDTSIKELQKLTGASDEVMAKSFQTASQSAQEYGSTIDAVLNSTSDWRRLGYSLSESEDLAKVTTMYQNIANGIDQSSASEYMVSILQGFQMDASDSLKIVDSVNEVAQNYAIDQAGGYARAYSNVGM